MRKFEGFPSVDAERRTVGQGSFSQGRVARTRGLSRKSGLWLVTLLPVLSSCQPSTNASAEGPVHPQTPAANTSPTPTETAPSPEVTPAPSTTNPTPETTTATTVNPAPTAVPDTTAAPTDGVPTTIPTTLPTTIPTTLPTTIPTTFPTAIPTETAPAPTTPDGSQVRTEGDRILLPGNIVFESGKTVLMPTPENLTILKQLQQFLNENPKVTQIRVEGYTDNVGNPDNNLKLSGERARAIKTWLVAQGVAAERVLAVGFGQEKPIADNSTPGGRAQNRRTEFKIATINGRPYRGVPILGGGTEFK